MPRRRKTSTRKTSTRKPKTSPVTGGVKVSASLKFDYPDQPAGEGKDYYTEVKTLHFDTDVGHLVATADCGDDCFVCAEKEIPLVIDFLQKIIATK